MEYNVVAALPQIPPAKALLTTNHSQSSYGQPVVVVNGVAYGSAEVLWLDGSKEARESAKRAGYTALSDEDSRWPTGYDAV